MLGIWVKINLIAGWTLRVLVGLPATARRRTQCITQHWKSTHQQWMWWTRAMNFLTFFGSVLTHQACLLPRCKIHTKHGNTDYWKTWSSELDVSSLSHLILTPSKMGVPPGIWTRDISHPKLLITHSTPLLWRCQASVSIPIQAYRWWRSQIKTIFFMLYSEF